MIESRCGILCSECDFLKKEECAGCTNIDRPFWGESCSVKSCCEEKQNGHCGECIQFPCDTLKQFAYDEQQGDDGKRIKQCEIWKG